MESRNLLDEINRRAVQKSAANAAKFGSPNWGKRHADAWASCLHLNAPTSAVPTLLVAAANYADAHRKRYDYAIGEDYVLGVGFADILKGVRVLLNGELGALDAGTLDTMVSDLAASNGIDPETFDLGYEAPTPATNEA